jgi:hypothetical protein
MGLLKRLDLVIAAVLVGAAVAPISSGYLCTESSCRSLFDTAKFYGLGILAFALAAVLFSRIRRWPLRVLVFAGALYSNYVVPTWSGRHGRWIVQAQSGAECLVHAGMAPDDVRRKCGKPSYWCRGPKWIDSGPWYPLPIVVCGFSGDVYRDRIVTYSCRGEVANVTGFDRGPMGDYPTGDYRPEHCENWGWYSDSR